MKKLKNILDNITKYFSSVIMVVMVMLVLWQVFTRYVLNNPSTFSEVLTKYLFVWLVVVSATYVFGQKEHMCISFVRNKFSKSVRKKVDIMVEVFTMVFSVAVMTIGGCIITKMQMCQIDSTLKIPLGFVYLVIPISGAIITIYSLYNMVEIIRMDEKSENENENEDGEKVVGGEI